MAACVCMGCPHAVNCRCRCGECLVELFSHPITINPHGDLEAISIRPGRRWLADRPDRPLVVTDHFPQPGEAFHVEPHNPEASEAKPCGCHACLVIRHRMLTIIERTMEERDREAAAALDGTTLPRFLVNQQVVN